ncbi:proline-rich transmembrane protein 4-like [Polyodon spathula]|uniref:proline-rich transmembrane protein 4-like n=1 Tax=Polyodon spathula TaxID=7913 RepID=UPI001B7F5C39|nr:proline-rich transmembrane protein 4-like [Polyodon spathula]
MTTVYFSLFIYSKDTMLDQCYMLMIVLWCSLLGTSVPEPEVQNVVAHTSPPPPDPVPPQQSSTLKLGTFSRPSWVPTDLTVASKTPSFLLLPFSLSVDLQHKNRNFQSSRPSTEAMSTNLRPPPIQPLFKRKQVRNIQTERPMETGNTPRNNAIDFARPSTVSLPSETVIPSMFTSVKTGTGSSLLTYPKELPPDQTTLPIYSFTSNQEKTYTTKEQTLNKRPFTTTKNSNTPLPTSDILILETTELFTLSQSPKSFNLELPTPGSVTVENVRLESTGLPISQDQEPTTVNKPNTELKLIEGKLDKSTDKEDMGVLPTVANEVVNESKIQHQDVSQKPTFSETLGTETLHTTLSYLDSGFDSEDLAAINPTESAQDRLIAATHSPSKISDPETAGTYSHQDWSSETVNVDPPALSDCNQDRTGGCDSSDTWSSTVPDDEDPENESYNLFLLPPMFVPLHADWNSAMATWGIAWEAHIYGVGSLFSLVVFLSALSLLCLPFRCPSGYSYFVTIDVFLLITGSSRTFSMFYDAYNHQDKLAATATLLLYEVPFPCLTSAFGIVFLLLSMRSRMQLSYSIVQHPCFLAIVVFLHFSSSLGSILVVQLFTQLPWLFFVSQGVFVALTAFMSILYFIFYCYVRADAKHIYHLNNTSPPIERHNRCPFADLKDWDKAAMTAAFSALFALLCAALQLYAMLHALGFGGMEVFHPWPWWAFHLSCRICEVGMCLTLALIVMYPLFCSNNAPHRSCWSKIFCMSHGHVTMKPPILPNNYQWSSSQQEKLVICDTITRGENECLPLYTLVENHLSSIEGLDLLYHSNRGLLSKDMELNIKPINSSRTSSFSIQMDSDSTVDLRPPSPINLGRSIDEALFSEALFPQSLFQNSKLYSSSNLSLGVKNTADNGAFKESPADRGLYRTSSCIEMDLVPPLKGSISSSNTLNATLSTEQWRGSSTSCLYKLSHDGSSLVLCSSPDRLGYSSLGSNQIPSRNLSHSSLDQEPQIQRLYQALGSAFQESSDKPRESGLALQSEFINVCRQIDELSVSSDTIDL